MLWDCHVHTKFSFDSEAEPRAQLQQAAALGLPGLCFTDHVDFDEAWPWFVPANVKEYLSQTADLADAFPGTRLCRGVEISLKDQETAQRSRDHLQGASVDCIIGSVHNTPYGDPYQPAFFEGRSKADAYRDYVEAIARRMKTCNFYQVLGHFDYVAKNAPYADPSMTYDLAPDAFDEIFRTLVQEGRTLEWNTSAQKDTSRPLWGLDILKRYVALGGEALSFGSDAHVPERIGWRFREAAALARQAGIAYAAHYVKGQRVLERL